MQLTIKNRITILSLLPTETNITNIRIIKELSEKLALTEEEIIDYEVKTIPTERGTQTTWNQTGNESTIEVTLKKPSIDLLKEQIEKLDKANTVTFDIFEVHELLNDV